MAALIAIDWGTTSFRAYRLSEQGEILEKRQSASGILSVEQGQFPQTLARQVGDWMAAAPDARVVMSGMIGSRQGWQEIAYVTGKPGLSEVAAAMGHIDLADGRRVWLAPGYSCLNADGQPDVMRGEETQILGACVGKTGTQTYCLPGTHSKWAGVADGQLTGFTTFMTGEVFDVMCKHSILGRLMTEGGRTEREAGLWFDDGVKKARAGISLLSGFFGVRARALFAEIPEAYTKDYLSGLLIGTEIRDARKVHSGDVTLIGSGHLIGLYGRAIKAFDGAASLADEDLAATGLYHLAIEMDRTNRI